jgi:DNA polymerase/3'-5' exonuclease PolX
VADPLDTNRLIASLLRDLAAAQSSTQKKWGYKRAASAILDLDEPIEQYVQADGTLRRIPNVGPSSTRVILEVLATGRSPIVEQAVAGSPRSADIESRPRADSARTS